MAVPAWAPGKAEFGALKKNEVITPTPALKKKEKKRNDVFISPTVIHSQLTKHALLVPRYVWTSLLGRLPTATEALPPPASAML